MENKRQKEYVEYQLNSILFPLMKEIMIKKPKNIYKFMCDFINNYKPPKKQKTKNK